MCCHLFKRLFLCLGVLAWKTAGPPCPTRGVDLRAGSVRWGRRPTLPTVPMLPGVPPLPTVPMPPTGWETERPSPDSPRPPAPSVGTGGLCCRLFLCSPLLLRISSLFQYCLLFLRITLFLCCPCSKRPPQLPTSTAGSVSWDRRPPAMTTTGRLVSEMATAWLNTCSTDASRAAWVQRSST